MKRRSLLLGSLACACTPSIAAKPAQPKGPPATPDEVGYPGPLLDPAVFGASVQWQQQVRASWQGDTKQFDAVLSISPDELLLLGLGPMSTVGFVLRLHEGQVSFENRSPHTPRFEPRYMLLDVQRVYFPWFPTPHASGERSLQRDGELIEELWSGGRLDERRFTRLDGRPEGTIVVRYSGWAGTNLAPLEAVLDSGWFGYQLSITTLTQQRLS